MTLLTVQGLTKRFDGVTAVEDVSFALARGELLALIGPNGAGKTTLFNMLGGALKPTAGRALLEGDTLTGRGVRSVWRMGVGRSFQIAAGFESMTVRENLQVALAAHRGRGFGLIGRAQSAHLGDADALLARIGLADFAAEPAAALAYGDLKRLDLALALAHSPKLLLLDEPTAGMAPAERAAMMALIAALVREDGVGALFTEHDMDSVFDHAHRILVLDRGRLIAEGPPDAIRDNARVRAVYLGVEADA